MFTRLNYILIFSVVVIAAFFVVSSMSFSGRLAEGEPYISAFLVQAAQSVCRLRRKFLEEPLVVARRLARAFVLCLLLCHRFLVAS
jgi:hypothetical protein